MYLGTTFRQYCNRIEDINQCCYCREVGGVRGQFPYFYKYFCAAFIHLRAEHYVASYFLLFLFLFSTCYPVINET